MTAKQLVKTVFVRAPPHEVWRAWSTAEGIRTFFGENAKVELRPMGPYEVYFDPLEAEGLKGSEGCKVLSFVPSRMLSFTWNAPPSFSQSRKEIAQWVVLFLDPLGEGTVVTLVELGWKEGTEEGEAVYRYFDHAWTTVLRRLVYRFAVGPIDWKNPYHPPESAYAQDGHG